MSMLDRGPADWCRELLAIASNGLLYCSNEYDRERYHQLRGVAGELLAHFTATSSTDVRSFVLPQTEHSTPKLDVRCLVLDRGNVLLVRESDDGLWSLPGGWVDVGELPREAAERETREEAGFDVTVTRLLAAWDQRLWGGPHLFHSIVLCFQAELGQMRQANGRETTEAAFFAPGALPRLSSERTTAEQVHRLLMLAERAQGADYD
jgi:ADP-ribose pyrophosphatase YjhB (NUDIX family)